MSAENRIFWGTLTVAALLLGGYTLTSPTNHSEANDAYDYAYRVETAATSELWHSQHLLYLPTAQGLFKLAHQLGRADRAFPVMLWFSRICGVLTVLVFFLLLRRRLVLMENDPIKSHALLLATLAGSGGLAFSYGFWRYSNETEIYTPAAFLIMLAWLAAAGQPTLRNTILSGVLAAFSCLMHILNVLPALIVLPLFLLTQRRIRHAFVYGVLAGSLTGAVYFVLFGSRIIAEIFATSAGQPEGGLSAASVIKGLVALAQNLTAGNFLFAFDKFQHAIVHLFPYRALIRQIFTGQHADIFARTMPWLTLAALLVLGIVLVLRRLQSRRAMFRPDSALAPAAALWFGLQVMTLLLTEPGGPENWVMTLPSLWLLITTTLYAPLAAAGRPLLPLAMAALLCAHNYFGGFRLLADPRGDYTACKSAWLLENAKPNDVILTADNFEFMRYLRYYSRAEVSSLIFDVTPANHDVWLMELRRRPGRIFATADVFELPASIQYRFPQLAVLLGKLGRELAPDFTRVTTNEFGGVFLHRPTTAP